MKINFVQERLATIRKLFTILAAILLPSYVNASPVIGNIKSITDSNVELCVNGVSVKSHHIKANDWEDKMFGTGYLISNIINENGNASSCTTNNAEADLKKYGIVSAKDMCVDGQQFLYLEVNQRTRVSLPRIILPKSKKCVE